MKPATSHLALAALLLLAGCGGSDRSSGEHSGASALSWLVGQSDEVPDIAPSALKAAATEGAVRSFYEARNWRAAWSPKAEQTLRDALDERARHGLDRVSFVGDLSSASPAERELALTKGALTYANTLARGLTDPHKLHDVYTIPRPQSDIARGLASALSGGGLGDWFTGLAPADDEYRALSNAYLDEREAAEKSGSADIAHGEPIEKNARDPRIPVIVASLRSNGYLDADIANDIGADNRYTPALAKAVERLQTDYGIAVDGVIGPDTLKVLNTGHGDRARAIAVALERLRWLQRTPPATRIDVNTAAAQLSYFRDGRLVDHRKVIVGQPGKETPQLQAPIFRLVANPTWTVPRSIQKSEMAGKGRAYFAKNNLEWRDGWIVQRPGEDNSLGLVKFDMDDDQAIYLHDTSAPSLFEHNVRQLSHGCVRVDDALGFARMLARDQGIEDEWRDTRDEPEDAFLRLPNQIPVRLLYHTVFTDTGGKVQFRTDPYGWNRPIATALGFASGKARRFRTSVDDIGP